ncbi:MAG: FIG00864354: hypothetical protein, partial [uncultured Nocardioides sp.]
GPRGPLGSHRARRRARPGRRRPARRPRRGAHPRHGGLHRDRRRPHRGAQHRAGRERRAHHRRLGPSRHAGPGGHHRPRDGLPGVQAAQHRARRPRLGGAVPAATVTGLGLRRADPRPLLLHQRLLRRPGGHRGLRLDARHRGGPGGAALRIPRGLRRPRGRRPGARLGAHRQLTAGVRLRGRRARGGVLGPHRRRGAHPPGGAGAPGPGVGLRRPVAGRLPAGRCQLGPHGGLRALRGPGDRRVLPPRQRGEPQARLGHGGVPRGTGLATGHRHPDLRRPHLARGLALRRRLDRLRRALLLAGRPGDPRAPRPRPRRRARDL